MAEPLEQVISSLQGRRSRIRPWEQNALIGDTGLRSQAMADAGQGVDIADAAPNTRLRARRGETAPQPQEYQESAQPSAPSGRGTPVMTAAGSNAAQDPVRQTQGQVRYEKVCRNGVCTWEPVFDGASQQLTGRALPPGVVEGPGERYVENSLREVARPLASAAPATVMPSGAQPAASQPGAQQSPGAMTGRDVAASLSPSFVEALDLLTQARSAVTPQEKATLIQTSRFHQSVGEAALKMQRIERMRKDVEALEAKAHELAQGRIKAENTRSEALVKAERIQAGYPDIDALQAIRTGPGSPRQKATLIVDTKINTMKNVPYDEKKWTKEFDFEFGQLTAVDAASRLAAAQTALTMTTSPDTAPRERARAAELVRSFGTVLHDRYGDIKSPQERLVKMTEELRPAFVDRWTTHFIEQGRPQREAESLAASAADEWIGIGIRGVERINDLRSAPPVAPAQPRPAAAPAKPAQAPAINPAVQAWGGGTPLLPPK